MGFIDRMSKDENEDRKIKISHYKINIICNGLFFNI